MPRINKSALQTLEYTGFQGLYLQTQKPRSTEVQRIMDRRLRNRILLILLAAGILAYLLLLLSGRQPVAKLSVVTPTRENIVSSISSNGNVEPISPSIIRAQLDTFVENVTVLEGQQVKKGQLLLQLDVKDAAALLAQARARLLKAHDDFLPASSAQRPHPS